MKKVVIVSALFATALCLAALGFNVVSEPSKKLSDVESGLEQQFSKIRHAGPRSIKSLFESNDDSTVLIDVREADEYSVSRIPGAIRISPDANPASIPGVVGPLTGKTVIFYCSVGYRSSRLATAAQTVLKSEGVTEIINLRGGIFAWHNEQLPLINDRNSTKFVHPYNARWAEYLKYKELSKLKADTGTYLDE